MTRCIGETGVEPITNVGGPDARQLLYNSSTDIEQCLCFETDKESILCL